MLEVDQVRQAIANNQVPPVSLWFGEERFLFKKLFIS